MKLLVFAVIVAVASAGCSNQCSGHGTCGAEDTCTCFSRWTGPDCSQRECPVGVSWVAMPKDSPAVGPGTGALGGEHIYSECSSKGRCDSDSGECECYAGFTGLACSRQVCPNDCSGHGRCISNNQYNSDYNGGAAEPVSFNSQFWDQDMSRQCACDRGWEGFACDKRMCPVGSDPLSCAKDGSTPSEQFIILSNMDKATPASGSTYQLSISLGFKDMFNGEYTTSPIRIYGTHVADTEAAYALDDEQFVDTDGEDFVHGEGQVLANRDVNLIRERLQEMSNFAIPSVNVTLHASDTNTYRYKVMFTNPANAGEQELMTCTIASPATDDPAVAPRMSANQAIWSLGTCKDNLDDTIEYPSLTSQDACEQAAGTCTSDDRAFGDGTEYDECGVCSDSSQTRQSTCKDTCDEDAAFPENKDGSDGAFTAKNCGTCWEDVASDDETDCLTKGDDYRYDSGQCVVIGTDDNEDDCSGVGKNWESGYTALHWSFDTWTTDNTWDQGGHAHKGVGPLPTCEVVRTNPCPVDIAHDTTDGYTGDDATLTNFCTTLGNAPQVAPVVSTSSVCSSRGTCDSSTGICACFDGYAGESCSIQTIFF